MSSPGRQLVVLAAVAVVLLGCGASVDVGTHASGEPARAHAVASEELPGRLILTRGALYDCLDSCAGPAGWFDLWAAGPAWRFRPLGTHRTTTPIPPRISPDGQWLLFSDGKQRLAVQQTATPGGRFLWPRRVVRIDIAHGATVNWAPDSAHLVLAGKVGHVNGIWIADRDGSHLHRIVTPGVYVEDDLAEGLSPAWSASGGIAFVGASGKRYSDAERLAVYTVEPDGSGLRRLTEPVDPVESNLSDPAWSPDGQQIAYSQDNDVRVVTVATATNRVLARGGSAPAWSPAGTQIAFLTAEQEPPVRVMPSTGGRSRPVHASIRYGFAALLDWRAQ